MRALLLEFDDRSISYADNEFRLKELLVAPVQKKKEAVTRKVYLPEGEWIDFNDGRTGSDGSRHHIQHR